MLLKLHLVAHLNTIRLVNDYNGHNESHSAMGTHNNVIVFDEEIEIQQQITVFCWFRLLEVSRIMNKESSSRFFSLI